MPRFLTIHKRLVQGSGGPRQEERTNSWSFLVKRSKFEIGRGRSYSRANTTRTEVDEQSCSKTEGNSLSASKANCSSSLSSSFNGLPPEFSSVPRKGQSQVERKTGQEHLQTLLILDIPPFISSFI